MTATLPPLLALAQGRAIRPRKGPLVRAKELLASLLKRQARPDWRWTHFPAGEARDKRQAAKLKAMGLRPGWPDFLLLPPSGLLHCLELKRQDEDLSDEQGEFFVDKNTLRGFFDL
jgi:hypothetical protein